jgi:hypothetical protein
MTWTIAGVCLLVYIVGSYVLMYRSLKNSPGPSGLGWLAFPAAPLMGPMLIAIAFRNLGRNIWRGNIWR